MTDNTLRAAEIAIVEAEGALSHIQTQLAEVIIAKSKD